MSLIQISTLNDVKMESPINGKFIFLALSRVPLVGSKFTNNHRNVH